MSLFAALRMPREVLFGVGQRRGLGLVARRYGRRVLVCTDSRLAADPVFAEMLGLLRAEGLDVRVDSSVQPDVPVATVSESASAAQDFHPEIVVAIGGGSCLDLAKSVALLLTHGGIPQDYYGEFKVPGPILPVVAVLTTAGTGSEVTPVAVLSDPERALKVGISSPYLIPQAAICDPELTLSCPAGLTAVAGADALTHAVEAFTAIRREPSAALAHERVFVGKSAITDHFALLAIGLLSTSLERACANGSDIAARSDVMLGALAAGMAFGTAGTAAAHAIQYPIGAITHTAHGLGVACVLPYVMRFNRDSRLSEFAQIARAMGLAGASEDALADAAIARVAQIYAAIGIPANLDTLGLPAEKLGWVSQQALGVGRLINNNPRLIDAAGMDQVLRAAHIGDLEAAAH
ncbi:MAG: iron-containing alcohol dehydrogenase [Devosia sp.]|nr:iron-containing alcohol dehydrogenase [Devosia sp.]